MVRLVSLCALSILVGGTGGWFLRGSDLDANGGIAAPSRPVAQLVSAPQPAATQSSCDMAQLHASIREDVAAALMSQAAMSQAAQQGVATRDTEKTVAPTAEVVEQRRTALRDIEGLITVDQWGATEHAEFRQKFALLDPEQARQAMREVMKALNDGSIHLPPGETL